MYFLIQSKVDSTFLADPDKCERTFTPYIREAQWCITQDGAERLRDALYNHENYNVVEVSFRNVS